MFKKVATLILISTLVAGVAQARQQSGFVNTDTNSSVAQKGGFKGPGIDIMTVKDVLGMRDDSRVRLKGQIIKNLGSEQYLFQDSTGQVEVDIDDKKWMGQTVTPNDTVEIYGKLDKELMGKTEIDVKRIQLVK